MIASTYVGVLLLDQHKDPRYTLPFLPAIAVIATYWIARLPAPRRGWVQGVLLGYCAVAYLAISFGTPLLPQEIFIGLPSSPLVSSVDGYTPSGDQIQVQGLRLWSQQSYPLGAPSGDQWYQEEMFQYAARPGTNRTLWFQGPNVDTIWFNGFAMTYFGLRYHVAWINNPAIADTAAIRTLLGTPAAAPPAGFAEVQEYSLPDGSTLRLYRRG